MEMTKTFKRLATGLKAFGLGVQEASIVSLMLETEQEELEMIKWLEDQADAAKFPTVQEMLKVAMDIRETH